MSKDDDEQAKKGDVEKAASPPKAARDESDSDDDRDEDDGDADEGDADEHDEESEDEDEDEDEDEGEDEHDEADKAAAAPAAPAKTAAPAKPLEDVSSAHEKTRAAAKAARAPAIARPRPVEAPPPPPPPVASMGKRIFIFAVLLVGLSVGLYFLPQSETPNGPRFKVGTTNEVSISVIPEDATALACASPQEINGKKCEFSSKTDRNEGLDDAKMLKPYTALDGAQFLAAGLWSQPSMDKSKLPAAGVRFGLKCKYVVDGIVKSPFIRWNPTQAWADKNPDWNAGILKDCVQVPLDK
ncbi:MAG: hypothetical protein U0414_14845 [Polyangiaceae bacterium]